MTTLHHLNYLAVFVAAFAYFILGALWYSPLLFVKPWMEGNKIPPPTEEDKQKMKKQMMPLMLTTLVCCFGATAILGCIEALTGAHSIAIGIKTGLAASVFTTVTLALNSMYLRKPFKLFVIDSAYHVCGLVIAGIILAMWA